MTGLALAASRVAARRGVADSGPRRALAYRPGRALSACRHADGDLDGSARDAPLGTLTCSARRAVEAGPVSLYRHGNLPGSGAAGSRLRHGAETAGSSRRNRFSDWLCEAALVSLNGRLGRRPGTTFCRLRWCGSLTCSADRTGVDFGRVPGPSWSHWWSKNGPTVQTLTRPWETFRGPSSQVRGNVEASYLHFRRGLFPTEKTSQELECQAASLFSRWDQAVDSS